MICPIGGNLCKSNCVARSSSADQGRSAQCSVLLPNPDLNLSSGRTFNPSPHNTSQRLRQSLLTWDEGSKPVTTTIPVPGVTTHIPLHKLSPPRTPPSPSPSPSSPTPLTLSYPCDRGGLVGNKVQSFHHLPIGAQNATNYKRVTTTTTTTNEDDVTMCKFSPH